jgi:hypothetical protein
VGAPYTYISLSGEKPGHPIRLENLLIWTSNRAGLSITMQIPTRVYQETSFFPNSKNIHFIFRQKGWRGNRTENSNQGHANEQESGLNGPQQRRKGNDMVTRGKSSRPVTANRSMNAQTH